MTEDEFRALGEAQLDECSTFGADGPDTFDCSGLVQFLLARIGIHADGRSAQDQHDYFAKPARADPIDEEDVAFGDLCFYGGDANDIHHVTIGWGGGKELEAGLGGRSTTTTTRFAVGRREETCKTATSIISKRGTCEMDDAALISLADVSRLRLYDWPDRGIAPRSYLKRLILCFARAYAATTDDAAALRPLGLDKAVLDGRFWVGADTPKSRGEPTTAETPRRVFFR